ncbi:hypothetical protein ACHAPA_006567 [Fusarium lateritium]
MARHGLVAILAVAAFGAGANAGPCKPFSSVGLSSTIIETATSTITTGTTGTTDVLETTAAETSVATESTEVLDTTVTETATGSTEATISIEATITMETATTLATTTAEATTTSVEPPPVCEPTQILVNPSFDDDDDGVSPWTLGAGVSISMVNPRSPPYYLYNTFDRGGSTTATFSQVVPALGSSIYQFDYYINMQTAIDGRDFSCSAVPRINGQELDSSETITESTSGGFKLSSQRFTGDGSTEGAVLSITVSCEGDFDTVIIGADDFSLQRKIGGTIANSLGDVEHQQLALVDTTVPVEQATVDPDVGLGAEPVDLIGVAEPAGLAVPAGAESNNNPKLVVVPDLGLHADALGFLDIQSDSPAGNFADMEHEAVP